MYAKYSRTAKTVKDHKYYKSAFLSKVDPSCAYIFLQLYGSGEFILIHYKILDTFEKRSKGLFHGCEGTIKYTEKITFLNSTISNRLFFVFIQSILNVKTKQYKDIFLIQKSFIYNQV